MDSQLKQSAPSSTNSALYLEKARYQRKGSYIAKIGYSVIFAFLLTVVGIAVFPQYLQYYLFQKLQSIQPHYIQMLILIGTHIICFTLGNIVMDVIYMMKSPFFERYRTRENPWPWDEDKDAWSKRKKEVFKVVWMNMFLGALMCVLDTYLSPVLRTDIETFPTVFEMMWQIVFSMMVEDTCFYWCHRTLHHPSLYSKIHKQHHEFHTTIQYAAIYAHPLEYIFGDVIPVFIGSKILGQKMHLATMQLWLMFRIGETLDGHSGYEFSWSPYRLLPFSASAEAHNYHHSHNIGNYESFFSFWDTIMGTNTTYNQFLTDKYENKKKQQ